MQISAACAKNWEFWSSCLQTHKIHIVQAERITFSLGHSKLQLAMR